MRPSLWSLSAGALLVLNGCSKKNGVPAQISEMEKAFHEAGGVVPVQTAMPVPNQPIPAEANAYLNVALSAVRKNDYAGGVIALQAVQRTPGVTAEQLMAVQGALQAMTADLLARASKGDPKAKADLAAIERSRSQ